MNPCERQDDVLAVRIASIQKTTQKNDAIGPQSAAKTATTEPRSGALGEPVAWANLYPDEEFVHFDRAYVEQCSDEGEVVPLYRHRQPTLTGEEREAVEQAIDAASGMAQAEPWAAATLRKMLERLK